MLKTPSEWQVNWLACMGQSYLNILALKAIDMGSILKQNCLTILSSYYIIIILFLLKVCIFCNTTFTSRILGCSVEHCPKYLNCSETQDSMMEKKNDIYGNCFSLFFFFVDFLRIFCCLWINGPLQILYTYSKVLFIIRKKG